MASYITVQELLDQGVPPDGLSGLTHAQLSDAIAWASDEIDGYISKRCKLPLVGTIPSDIKRRCAVLASYSALTRRGFRPGAPLNEMVQDMYEKALDWLLLVSKGDVTPQWTDSTPEVDEEGSLASSEQKMTWRTFTGKRNSNDPDFGNDPV